MGCGFGFVLQDTRMVKILKYLSIVSHGSMKVRECSTARVFSAQVNIGLSL